MANRTMTVVMGLEDWATVYAGLRSAARALRKEAQPGYDRPAADCNRVADMIMAVRRGRTVDGVTGSVTGETETGPFLSPVAGRA